MNTPPRPSNSTSERRRHTRTPIGLPVRVHFAGHTLPVTLELSDVSLTGCYFSGVSAPGDTTLAFGFVLPHRALCLARARVVRVERTGFAAELERVNGAFADFVSSLSQAIPASAA